MVPASDNVYSLGSATKAYKDIFVGPGSLYINGKKAIEDDSNTMTFSTDVDQDMRLASSGVGSVELLASGTGSIQAMGTLSMQSSKRIVDAAGVNVEFGNPVHMNSNKITNLAEPTVGSDGATKTYVDTAITNLVDSSPATLDTLNELAAALGDDANFSTTITAAIRNKVKRIVYCSSMARYGHHDVMPYKEDYECRPQDPYGIAKKAGEDVLRNLCETHGVEYVIAVPHNIVGPRQKYDDPFRNVMSIMSVSYTHLRAHET